MAEVRTRDEALQAVLVALDRWGSDTTGALAQGAARLGAAAQEVAVERTRAAQRLAVAAAARERAATPDEQARAGHELREAEARLAEVDEIAQAMRISRAQLAAVLRQLANATASLVPGAVVDLRRRLSTLASYRAGGAAFPGAESAAKTGRARGAGPLSRLDRLGLTEVNVGGIDFSDNPIQGSFGRGGASRADYRWAVETWSNVVEPAVARGADRTQFERRDHERDAPPLRRTADVHDLFLGTSDRIVLSRRADGSLDVINGRRRLLVARELGVKTLPAQVLP
jgi:hypothetical protein